MTAIQVIMVFMRLGEMPDEMHKKIKDIVREEYCRAFSCQGEDVRISLHDGSIRGNVTDIHLSINSEEKYYNEGLMRMEMRKAISNRLMLLFPNKYGFHGIVTTTDGIVESVTTAAEDGNPADKVKAEEGAFSASGSDPAEVEKRSAMYEAVEPRYSFDMVRLPKKVFAQIERALGRIAYEKKVFDEWGLYAIMPSPVSALGFFGPPGTGKTLAAEAIADKVQKKIVRASYAELENKYVGEGPKNVKALFYAAEKQDAVLFIDEADSLLSKRLTNVTDGTGQAFNSMRSQLLMSLENFHGIAIFATNLVVNYDQAFLSRLISIEFENPDIEMRREIWETHLLPKMFNGYELRIPLARDIDIQSLAEEYDLCGRDIRNAVVDACVEACIQGKDSVDQECLRFGAKARKDSYNALARAEDHTAVCSGRKQDAADTDGLLAGALQDKLNQTKELSLEKLKKEAERKEGGEEAI